MFTRFAAAAILAAAILPSAQAADKLVFPVAPVLAHPDTVRALKGMQVRFGAGTPASAGPVVEMSSWARPTDPRGGGAMSPDGRPVNMTPEQSCALALRFTLEFMAEEARERGGKSLADVVSFTGGKEFNSPASYECEPRRTSSTVTLKGRAAP